MGPEVTLRLIEGLRTKVRPPHPAPEEQLKQLSFSVAKLGFSTPVLVEPDGSIVAGHGRVEAARALGISEVPCLSVAEMSEADKRAYFLAHHKLAIEAGWGEELLASELDGNLELTRTRLAAAASAADEKSFAESEDGEPVVRVGDLWTLGPHRLLCGEASQRSSYAALMGHELAQLVFTEPLCPSEANNGGAGRGRSRAELSSYLTSVFVQLAAFSEAGSIHYICTDWRNMRPLLDAGEAVYGEPANLIIWVKDATAKGFDAASGHELVFAFEKPNLPIDGQHQRSHRSYRRDVWPHIGGAALHTDEAGDAVLLPTIRPVSLVADAILESTEPGAIVLDAFCGSGTLLAAAHATGRSARAVELDPRHCDRAIRRWQALTGGEATLAETGQSFCDLEATRKDRLFLPAR